MRSCILVLLLGFAGCGHAVDRVVAGRTVSIVEPTLRKDLQGCRVVDLEAIQRLPMFEWWSPEIEERLAMAGSQVAVERCGGPAELAQLTPVPMAARAASLRFRCL